MRYAIVRDGTIVNVILAEAGQQPEGSILLLEPGEAHIGIGWTWDGIAFTPRDRTVARSFTPLELVGPGGILTDAEKAAIATAAASDIEVELWRMAMLSAEAIHVDDPRTIDGFAFAVSKGLLTAERVQQILAP